MMKWLKDVRKYYFQNCIVLKVSETERESTGLKQ